MINLFVSNNLSFTFVTKDNAFYYTITIVNSRIPGLVPGMTCKKIDPNWEHHFVLFDLKDVELIRNDALVDDLPWT